MDLKIKSKEDGTTLTLELQGKLSIQEAKVLEDEFTKTFPGKKEVLLDFTGINYISSAGLRSLFVGKKMMMKQGGDFKVLYPSPEVMEVFEATRYDNIVTIVPRGENEKVSLFYPMRPIQRWMVDTHFQRAQSTMMNTGGLIRLDSSIDLELLADAVNDLLEVYDIFRCRMVFHPETGDICQRFDGDLEKVRVEILSDEGFEKRKQDVKKPYELIDHPLYRIYIMKTSSANYLYVDFYHVIMDGTAIALLFLREMDKRYTRLVNHEPLKERQIPSYADYILKEAEIPEEDLLEGREYWKKMIAGFDSSKYLPKADIHGESESQEHELEVPFPEIDKSFFKGKDFNENTFFMGAAMLALAKSSGQNEAILSWVHNGRFTSSERRLMGLMLDQFPIRWHFERGVSAVDFLHGLEARLQEGMQYRKSMDVIYEEGLEEDTPCFILQKGSMGRRGSIKFCGTEAVIEEMPANEISAAENSIDIEMNSHDDGTYSLVLDYDNHRYSENAMKEFAETMEQMAYAMMKEGCMLDSLLNL